MSDDRMTPGCDTPNLVMAEGGAPPTVAMMQLLDTGGAAPGRGPTNQGAENVMAMVHSFAGVYAAWNAPPCIGQSVNAGNNMQLAGILDDFYGGDDQPDFNLPDLRGRVAAGGPAVGTVTGNALTMTWMIVAEAAAWEAFPTFGMLGLFAGNFAPSGWLVADGSSVAINDYSGLYSMIGNSFGGDGGSFNLPDLRGRTPIGTGVGPGRPPVALGEVVEGGPGVAPALGLTWLICVEGPMPSHDGYANFPSRQPTLGEVVAFAGLRLPVDIPGWAPCDGSLLRIAENTVLFAVIRNTFGGDGNSTFALPDLRGRMLTGSAS